MKREMFAKDVGRKITQFHQAFDRDDALLTAVLRGHMMIEERLHDVISAGVARYSRPHDRNDIFTFGTATELCKSIAGLAASPDLWDAVKSLNNLRNALGHRNEPARLGSLLLKFFKQSEPVALSFFKVSASYDPEGEDESTHAIAVRNRITAMWTVLGILADDLARDLDSVLEARRH
ncbi:hypothetical protein SAMN05660659_04622 [Pseudomonas sp. LAMO17WK12:I6]|uniref:hypothetical protein n=1 Tax=unclassified Pseudomonas TaxID=196821 RepID=UPI000BDDAC78|nr:MULTISPECIES: hypothetical protein [unclassified Pseudomonas]SNY42422.1 hypothetical protein SAMN05660659_04622 [Pseudomonas sp. LAMO17WK12:I6]SNY43651.1 hypothetical protein SAMN05660455_04975 [Pseudomonas sp. LAMO17WK12:I5]